MNVIEKMARAIIETMNQGPIDKSKWQEVFVGDNREAGLSWGQAAYNAMMQHLAETGQVIVPEEPTQHMLSEGWSETMASWFGEKGDLLDVYRAMIAAAKEQA